MSYKLVFCDLDETLLDKSRHIPIKNIEAIKKAKNEYDVKFVCATGRHFSTTMNILKELDLYDQENEYVCSLNGAILSENKNNRILHTTFLPYERASEFVKFGLEHHLCIELYTLENTYIYNLNDDERERVHQVGLKYTEILDHRYDFLKNENILKMVYQSNDFEYIKSLENKMQDILGDIIPSYSSNRYMELYSKDTSKGIALKYLAHYLGIDISETIAIGDHYNDVSMLEAAGLSVAANNAIEDVKQLCDYVTVNDHNEGVVAEVLEKYIFNKEE